LLLHEKLCGDCRGWDYGFERIGSVVRSKTNSEVQVPTHLASVRPHLSNPKIGLLIVGHGSRRAEANEDVHEAARLIGERGGFSLVEAAFLEIEDPDVAEGFSRLVARGAREIIIHPYFLSPGRHTRGDLPREVSEVSALHPHVAYRISEPLSAHPLVIEAAIERIRETRAISSSEDRGKVYLVGAGPGDPRLLTLRARELLASCDVVLYDYLVDPEILKFARPGRERLAVGKIGGGRCTPQSQINEILIERARAGKCVVRLKGGDPFLFGRGGEEAEALFEAGVPFEVVPGVTSALAVPAYAGIPLTHRDYSSSVAVVTGAHAGDGACNSRSLSTVASADTIVILMGLRNLREVAANLSAAGRAPETPVAVIRWGSYQTQQTVVGTLASIAVEVERAGLRAPAVVVVGEIVRMRERLNWFEQELSGNSELETAFVAA
jgi:uroporphyrin-III C-methyltransferase